MEDDVAAGDFNSSLGFAIVTFNSQDVRKFFLSKMSMTDSKIHR